MRKFFRAVLMMKSAVAIVAVGFAISEVEYGVAESGIAPQQGGVAATAAADRHGG